MEAVLKVLRELLIEASKKWYQKGRLDYSTQFAKIQEILLKHQYYGDLKKIEKHFNMKCSIVSD